MHTDPSAGATHEPMGTSWPRLEQGLWFLMACLPFCSIVRLPPYPVFWGEWVAVTLFAAWLALRPALAAPGPRVLPWSAAGLLALAALMLLQLMLGMAAFPVSVVLAAVALALAAALAAASASLTDPVRRDALVTAFAWGLLAALVLNAAAVVLGWSGHEILLLGIYPTPVMPRAIGLVGQANHLGTLAVLGMAAAFYLQAQGRLRNLGLWAVVALAAVVCAASSSRIALVTGLLALGLTAAWWKQRGVGLGRLAGMALLFLAVQVGWVLHSPVTTTRDSREVFTRSADAGRVSMLKDSVSLWQQHPVLGVGQGNYAARRLHDLQGPMPAPHADHAHNLLAQAVAEWGSLGLALVAALAGLMLWVVWQRLHRPEAGADELMAATWVLCLLAHSLVEHPLWFMHWLLPLALMAGLLKQPLLLARPAAAPHRAVATALALAVVLSVSAYAGWDYERGQTLAMRMIGDNQQPTGTPRRVSFAEVAQVESLTLFPRFARIMLSQKLPLNDQLAQAKLDIARQAMDAVPTGETLARFATFAAMAGQGDEARPLLEGFSRRNPDQYHAAYLLMQGWARTDPRLLAFVATLPVGAPLQAPGVPAKP